MCFDVVYVFGFAFEYGVLEVHQIAYGAYYILTIFLMLEVHFLAKRWPKIIRNWSKLETNFLTPTYMKPNRSLKSFCLTFSAIFFWIWITTIIIFEYWRYKMILDNMAHCGIPSEYLAKYFFFTDRSYIFQYVNFNIWTVALKEYVVLLPQACWCFTFLYTMIIVKWLSLRWQQLLGRISLEQKFKPSENVWNEIYDHFKILISLTREVDQELANLNVILCLYRLLFLSFFIFKLIK